MNEGTDLWKKYCAFYDHDFAWQMEYNERRLRQYFKKWKNTKTAKHLCPKGVKSFEDVPLTTYDDYPVLHKFGEEISRLEKTEPRRKGELLLEYYDRIGKQAAPLLDGWLPGDYCFCASTGGTTGPRKWIAHVDSYKPNMIKFAMRMIILACSENEGETDIKPGENILNVVAPVPYLSGYAWRFFEDEFTVIPSFEITDNIADVRKKMNIMLKMLKKKRVSWVGGTGSYIKLIHDYLMNPEELFKEMYKSSNIGLKKLILYFIWKKSQYSGSSYESIEEIMPLKGMMVGGMGTAPYKDFINESFGLEPLVAYGCTEGIVMSGLPGNKLGLHPSLDQCYFEFLEEGGEVRKIDEVKKNRVYEVHGTVFDSMLIRYSVDDLLRVIGIRDDGMPIFQFESRKSTVLDFYGWFRLTEAKAEKLFYRAGLRMSDNWAVAKELEPKEHISVLMEKEWDYDEEKACARLFNSLIELDPNFRNWINDFNVKDPAEIIEINYLPKGAFRRYAKLMEKQGKPLTHYKPPKLITTERHEIAEILREI